LDESIHFNNLAIVYAANGKRNLALHSCARSLRASSSEKVPFARNGTARPELMWSKVHNAAILAFQARNYVAAYECMANCVQNSKEYSERLKCWLRMAEACIGKYMT
jgi:DNA-binding FadR family transcriptional regulator